jgi:hypothetical protein
MWHGRIDVHRQSNVISPPVSTLPDRGMAQSILGIHENGHHPKM